MHTHNHANCVAQPSHSMPAHEVTGSVTKAFSGKRTLCIRPYSGLSGDMFLCGLICLLELTEEALNAKLTDLFPQLNKSVTLTRKSVGGISGYHCRIELPHEHKHRTVVDISGILESSGLSERGKALALRCFNTLAEAEAAVHGIEKSRVHFHEVGALDSILDIGLTCELFALLSPEYFVCGPLPLADGDIRCAHGVISSPAPAVCALLDGMRVAPFEGRGETVTPTAAALLKTFDARFGSWPLMTVRKTVRVYGDKEFPDVPNGALFVLGEQNA